MTLREGTDRIFMSNMLRYINWQEEKTVLLGRGGLSDILREGAGHDLTGQHVMIARGKGNVTREGLDEYLTFFLWVLMQEDCSTTLRYREGWIKKHSRSVL